MTSRNGERNVKFPPALREKIQSTWRARGYRSEQQFIIDACREAIEGGEKRDAVPQVEERVVASLNRVVSELRSLRKDLQASHAFLSAFAKAMLTCVVEPKQENLPAARTRAQARYQRLIQVAAREMQDAISLGEIGRVRPEDQGGTHEE